MLQDLRTASRALLRRPGFTATAVATLALGIGANTLIFSIADGVLFRPLPYAAPEQVIEARNVDGRTDVYGLGSTLYQLLSGRTLFLTKGQGLMEIVAKITLDEPEPLLSLRRDCPAEVADLVHRMVAKEAASRPAVPEILSTLGEARGRLPPEEIRRGHAPGKTKSQDTTRL